MKKKILYTVVLALTLLGLTTCGGKKKVEYNVTEGGEGSNQATEEVIPERLEYFIQGELGDVTVYADVKLPDAYQNCAVVELEEAPFEDEDIKRLADSIFDQGTYFLYMPYNSEEVAFLLEQLRNLSQSVSTEREDTKFDEKISWLEEMNVTGFSTDKLFENEYEELRFYKINDVRPEICNILGEIDGRYYILQFERDDTNCRMTLERWECYEDIDATDTGAESIDMRLEGNPCTYTMDEAEKLALDYIRELGYEDYDVVWTNNVYCNEYNYDPNHQSYDSRLEGYNVYLGRSYENYSFTYSSENYARDVMNTLIIDDAGNAKTVEGFEFARVYVDNQGICQVELCNPMIDNGAITEDVILLPFEKVDSVAQEILKAYADSSDTKWSIMEVELGYGMVKEDGKVALIPMWYYFQGDYSKESHFYRNAIIRINALDGSLVDE